MSSLAPTPRDKSVLRTPPPVPKSPSNRRWFNVLLFLPIFALSHVLSLKDAVYLFVPHSSSVLLTHGNASASVVEGTSILDVVKSCPSLYGANATYESPWWLRSGDAQTIWNSIGDHTKTDVIHYERRYLRVPDNGTLVLDTYPPFESVADDTPIVIILHGITGSSEETSSRVTVNALTRPQSEGGPGFRTVVLNLRGCDGSPVTSSRLYHAGETDDLRSVLLYLTHTWPTAPLYAVGFSMGAATLGVYLGQQGEDTPIKAAISVSSPWNWSKAAHYIETATFLGKYVYGPIMARNLRSVYLRNVHAFPEKDWDINTTEVESAKYFTIRWYDDRVTSKIFGFIDAEDYYTQASPDQYMDRVKVPLLALHALDDPIVHASYLPWDGVNKSEHIVFASTDKGGHVGWFKKGQDGIMRRWYAEPIVEFLEQFHNVHPSPKAASPTTRTKPDADGLVHQAGIPPDRVGFKLVEGEPWKPLKRVREGLWQRLRGRSDTGLRFQ